MAVAWDYFNRFEKITDKYLPDMGEGETMATQTVTAVCKIVYRWYNDGDVYDNQYMMCGWANNLSDYANWLRKYADAEILDDISDCWNGDEYEDILQILADKTLDPDFLEEMDKKPKQGSIYDCEGKFAFVEEEDEEEDLYW